MPCDHIRLDLPAYLQGALSPTERAAVENHLATCHDCAEEATALSRLGDALSRGLKGWVEEGVCPPALMARLESHISSGERKSWFRRWPVLTGATAAALLLLVLASRVEQVGQLASIMGAFTAQLVSPRASAPGAVQERVVDGIRILKLDMSDEHVGIRLRLHEAAFGHEMTRIHFTLRGTALDSLADGSRFTPVLEGPEGVIPLRDLTLLRGRREMVLYSEFDPVAPGQVLTFRVADLPVRMPSEEPTRPWQVQFSN